MTHIGYVVLPDGRVVVGTVTATHERDTNAVNVQSVDLAWEDGEPLTADEYNEDLGETYLHEFVTDKLLLMPAEDPYWEPSDMW